MAALKEKIERDEDVKCNNCIRDDSGIVLCVNCGVFLCNNCHEYLITAENIKAIT